MKKIIVSVTNDLATDQRVARMCSVFHYDLGLEVLLIGRKLKDSLPLNKPYKTKRLKLIFNKGALFYAEYNFRLFWILLIKNGHIFVANDLDTLLPNFLVAKIRKKKLVYDTHEYFTGVPELDNRTFVKKIWTNIEKRIFPKLKEIITVNDSIADIYQKLYKKNLTVVRNVPNSLSAIKNLKTRIELKMPIHKKILILQGAGINIDRGAEETVLAMQFIEEAILYIIGGGDVIEILKKMVKKHNLQKKVIFKSKMPYTQLMSYTFNADIGITLDKPTNINYKFSLPNKLFDYIQAQTPILASSLIEIEKIVKHYDIGLLTKKHEPKHIALLLQEMFNSEKREIWKKNLKIASKELCWENEKQKVISIYKKLI